MFGELGLDKLLMLLVLFLLIFGSKRIPEIGRSLGKGIREFKGSLAGLDEPLDTARATDESRSQPALPLSAAGTDLVVRKTEPVRRLT